jgi:uncharacterized membrane protein YjjP (DUF1212 family)
MVTHVFFTARTGLFIRDYPGRLIILPAMSSTCAVIFFGGTHREAGVAAICGLVTGLIEYFLVRRGLTKMLFGKTWGKSEVWSVIVLYCT